MLLDINLCDSGPCQNNASCENFRTFYTCNCAAGFEGVNCQTGKTLCQYDFTEQAGKTADISWSKHWFPGDMRSEWNKRRNSILMMCHHPYLGSASDWLKICFIQSEAISRSDQYGISALISQKSFRGEIRGGVMKYGLFSGASMMFSALKVSKNCWEIKPFCELKSRNYEGSVNLVYNYSFFTDIDECKQDPCQNGASCKVNIMNWHHNIYFPRQVHGYGRK